MSWRIYPATEFEQFGDTWRKLQVASGHCSLMELDFVAPLLANFGSGKELLAVHESKNLVDAAALVVRKKHGIWETWQPSQSPVGLWLQRPEQSPEQLLPKLMSALPGFALGVAVTQQDSDIVPRIQDTDTLRTLDYIQTARVSIKSSFDEYWSQRGKNLRQNIKKQKNSLAKDGITPRLEVVTAPEDIPQALHDYASLESVGWKATTGTAIREDNDQGRFYMEMLTRFARAGRTRIYRYRFNEKVVAVDMCIETDDQMVVLKTTYDETIRSVSPATLLRHDYFQTVFNEGRIKRIEFYGKVMNWHTKWTDEFRTIYHINCYRWTWLPRLRGLLSRGERAAKLEEKTGDTETP